MVSSPSELFICIILDLANLVIGSLVI